MPLSDQETAFQPVRLMSQASHGWVVLQEAAGSFVQNADLRQASSLAFYSTLSLIPALLLLTFLLSLGIGSSQAATQKTAEFVGQVIPSFGEVILKEVRHLASHPRAAGSLNLLVLTWSLTPLVSSLRQIISGMFKTRNPRTLLASKARDLAMGMLFITGLALVAGAGVFLHFLGSFSRGLHVPFALNLALPFGLTVLLVWGVYFAFTPRVSERHLLAGAITTTVFWFLLRPAFTLFLTHDPGYGFAFGSFKSIFIVIIWIYYSLAVLLFGAEVTAALHRGEALAIRRLMKGQGGSDLFGSRFLRSYPAGCVIFAEGDGGREMYHILRGAVRVTKEGEELTVLRAGTFFAGNSSVCITPRKPSRRFDNPSSIGLSAFTSFIAPSRSPESARPMPRS